MFSDLKYAFRQLIKRPGFTVVAVLILALGIASNTAVFTVIDTLLLRGLPVPHSDELVLISKKGQTNGAGDRYGFGVFEQFRDHAQSLAGVIGFRRDNRLLIASGFGRSDGVPVATSSVSGNFFSFLGVSAALGRTLTLDDNRADAPRPVVMLSHAFWKRQFGADPAAIGKTVLIDNVQVTIVGVAAAGFSGVEVGSPIDLWIPTEMYPIFNPAARRTFQEPKLSTEGFVRMMGRLRPGVKPGTADAELDGIYKAVLANGGGISSAASQGYGYGKVDLQPGGSGFIPGGEQVASLLEILMLVVGMVLVIACANVASLLLARAAVRQREFALRTALGASRGRLIGQLMMESLLLAAAGGLIGLLFAHWGTLALAGYLPWGGTLNLRPDVRVLAFTAFISIATGVLVGLVPALRFSRLNLVTALKDQAGTLAGGSGQKLNKTLVAVQIALSVCLLAGAGLFVRTLENLRNADLGFKRSNLLLAYVNFDKSEDPTRRITITRDLLGALEELPEVRSASFTWGIAGLLSGSGPGNIFYANFSVDGHIPEQNQPPPRAYQAFVGPRFLETLGIPLLHGRGIESADAFPLGGAPAPNFVGGIVINESMARKYFGNGDPIGHQIRIPDAQTASIAGTIPVAFKIMGVVKDTKEVNLRDENLFEIYQPSSEASFSAGQIIFELRTSGDPLALVPGVRSTIHTIDPRMPSPFFNTVDLAIDGSLSQERMIAQTAGFFSGFALLLASLGLYGVLAYNVAQRTREIGVRMALGARPGNIVSLILRQGLGLTLAGCVAGIAAAMALGHLIASRLYGVPPLDPLTFILTAIVLILVALLACWLPARRATKVDPMIALRSE